MGKKALEIKIGLLTVFALLLVLLFALFKGHLQYRRSGYEIRVVYEYVAGIEKGSPVRVSGVRVGEVKSLEINYETEPKVILTLYLDGHVKLGRSSQFLIRSYGLIGEKYVEIIPSLMTDLPIIAAQETMSGEDPMEMDRLMALGEELGHSTKDLVVALEGFFGDPRFKAEFFGVLTEVRTLSARSRETLDRLDEVAGAISETAGAFAEAARAGQGTLESARGLSDSAAGLVGNAGELVETARQTIDENRPLLNQALMNFQLASAGLVRVSEELSSLAALARSDESSLGLMLSSPDLYRQLSETLSDARSAMARLDETLAGTDLVVEDIRAAKGTVGKLLYSEELYNDLRALVGGATEFTTEIRARPWRLLRVPRGEN